MFNNFGIYPKKVRNAFVTLLSSAVLSACGGGAGTTDSGGTTITSPRASSTIQGSAIKGVIENGIVNVYLVEDQAGSLEASSSPVSSVVRTNSFGAYSIVLPDGLEDATVIVDVTADSQTMMTCDVTDGCGVDAQNVSIVFGQKFALDNAFSLKGFVTGLNAGDSVDVHVSPLTHLVVAKASSSIGGFTSANLISAIDYIEATFELASGAMDSSPADITSLDSQQNLSQAEIEMGVISAAFLSLVNTPDWDSVDEVLDHVALRLSSGGQISSVNLGALRDVALDEVFLNASDIAEDLAAEVEGAAYVASLNSVAQETAAVYEELSQGSTQITPVTIVSQPVSSTVDEGELVQLSVAAQGGGSLLFQWRKSGTAISGANESTLTISVAELDDAGNYDVLVTNSVGSVASLAALVLVNEVVVEPEPVVASIELNWDIPTSREDGSDLELYEIDGYVIAYGTESGSLTTQLTITGAADTDAVIDDLPTDTYYFAISTVDSDGVQGNYSSEITLSVM